VAILPFWAIQKSWSWVTRPGVVSHELPSSYEKDGCTGIDFICQRTVEARTEILEMRRPQALAKVVAGTLSSEKWLGLAKEKSSTGCFGIAGCDE